MTDDTNPGNLYDQKDEDNHQQIIGGDVIISLSNDMMENCMKWSLHDFALDVMNCGHNEVDNSN